MRGVVMAVQIAIVHVIVVIVWLADLVLRGGFGLGLSDVTGVRAASFLIIVGIGLYMLYQAVRASLRARSGGAHGHSRLTITVPPTITTTAITMATVTAVRRKAAFWRSRPAWSPAPAPC